MTMRMKQGWEFQESYAPKRSAKEILHWLSERFNKIKLLEWPIQSPELNPTENPEKGLKKWVHRTFEI